MAITLQQIFKRYFDAFAQKHGLSRDMRHAVDSIRACRTRALGGHVNSCPTGHFHQIAYNSCMHRCCPLCAWSAREQWLAGWKARLLPTGHHHLVFTLPHDLNDLWRFNRKAFAKVLFGAASQTLLELLADGKYLGARPGILAALHTWNQKLEPHIHLHVLVTAGGLNKQDQWVQPVKSCLLPRQVLMLKFRGKFKAMLRRGIHAGRLGLPPKTTRRQFDQLLRRLNRSPWNVKVFPAYAHGEGVATYLARYIKGGPIGNSRLIDIVDGRVVFRSRLSELEGGDGKLQRKTSLPIDCFIGRWLQHVPPARFQSIRGYGLYSGNQHSRLPQARAALGLSPQETPRGETQTWQERCESAGLLEVCQCPKCGLQLISHHHFKAGRDPPLSAFRFHVRDDKPHEAA